MPKRLGVIPHLFARPLFRGIREQNDPTFELVEDNSTQLAIRLRQGNLDGAFLSPIEYAKEYASYSLVPDVGVISEGESGIAVLMFKERLSRITTIAVNAGSSSEIVLAHLVMAEKYDTVPQFVPMTSSPELALKSSDAVLLVGDEALAIKEQRQKIDLVDEWLDITGLPFIHGVWAVRPGALQSHEIRRLIEFGREAYESREKSIPEEHKELTVNLHYTLSAQDITALIEFFRMSYYHGIIGDIPDVKVLPLETNSNSEVSVQ